MVHNITTTEPSAILYTVRCSEEREEASKLMEEADMPLDTLLAQYVAGREEGWEEEGEEEGGGEGNDEGTVRAPAM